MSMFSITLVQFARLCQNTCLTATQYLLAVRHGARDPRGAGVHRRRQAGKQPLAAELHAEAARLARRESRDDGGRLCLGRALGFPAGVRIPVSLYMRGLQVVASS